MKATLKDMLSNQFRDAKEDAYHLEQSHNYMENQVVWESRQKDLKRPQPGALVFYGPLRNPNEPPRYLYNKDLFYLKYGNTKKKKYVLSLHKIHVILFPEEDLEERLKRWKVNYRENKLLNSLMTFIRNRVIWERVHDFQLGIESYQIKINLNAPTLIFPGIEECNPFSIVDKLTMGLIYLNSKEEKRVMYLIVLSKFCDATLEKAVVRISTATISMTLKELGTPLHDVIDTVAQTFLTVVASHKDETARLQKKQLL
ncbi:hypothetical protein Tco_1198000 [Tanacetum coccineum]